MADDEEKTEEPTSKKIEDARNLLYVATTRATLNLSILYSEDISSFEENVKKIFGEIKTKI